MGKLHLSSHFEGSTQGPLQGLKNNLGCRDLTASLCTHMQACTRLLKYIRRNRNSVQLSCPFPVLSRAQNESLGAGADPGHDPLCPVLVPPQTLPFIQGRPLNLSLEALLQCPRGDGALVGKGLRLCPFPSILSPTEVLPGPFQTAGQCRRSSCCPRMTRRWKSSC